MIRTDLLRVSLAGAGALMVAALASAQATLNVKPGLWEVTTTTQMSGVPQIDTSKMPPDQRARAEAAMGNMPGAKPTVVRQCMTQERIDKQMFSDPRMDPSCKQSTITRTATMQELKIECTGEHQASGTLRFTASDPEHVKGTVAMNMSAGGRGPVTMNSTFESKWISADCGDVK